MLMKNYFLKSLTLKVFIIFIFTSVSIDALAKQFNADNCQNGNYIEATIISDAQYQKASKFIKGIPLSHTKFHVKTNDDNELIVVVDNVFAHDFDPSNNEIPQSFQNNFIKNQQISLCGLEFSDSENGIHWVHTNCGKSQDKNPDGFVVINGYDFTDSTNYCYLWE